MKVSRGLLARLWVYFRRGYSTYLVFGLSIANFIVIQYRLLIERIPLLKAVFPSIVEFAISLLLVLATACVLIGYIDFKRFSVSAETELIARANPWNKVLARTLIELVRYSNIPEDRKRELIQMLSRYT